MDFGRKISIPPFRGFVASDLDGPRFLEAVSTPAALLALPGARVLQAGRNIVAAIDLPVPAGGIVPAVIKSFRPRGLARLKTLVGRSKAAKAWRGALACLERGVTTPRPLAFLERRKAGFVRESYFLAERAGGREIRFLFRELSGEELRSLLSELAVHIALCHDRGLFHRDLSDGNILVAKARDGRYRFSLLDTNRIRVRRKISRLGRVRNLVRLGVPPAEQDFFLDAYLGDLRTSRILRFWYRKKKKNYEDWLAVKKKLRLRRLAEKLRIQ